MYIAEGRLEKGDYEEAVIYFGTARDKDESNRRIQEGQQKAKRLLKQSQKRDYYKILAIDRSATKREIKKAFRKLATKWV